METEEYLIILDTETNGLPLQCKQSEDGRYPSLDNREAYRDLFMLQISMIQVYKEKKEFEYYMINSYVKPPEGMKVNYDGFPRYYQAFYV